MKFWRHLGVLSLLLLVQVALALPKELQSLDPIYISFIQAELSNSYEAQDSTVNSRYRGRNLEPFKVGYLEVPAERLNLELSQAGDQILSDHFYVKGSGKKKIRFYIHPDSEHLYQPLIKEFGYKGYYYALPTASTRSVLAWDPDRPQVKPLFLKLSLAQMQDRLGRIIPGWEVRRSVRVTDLVASDLRSGKVAKSNVGIIPEVGGAYVKAKEGLSYFVDADQGQVSEHGYILRDASFLEKYRGKTVVPMFWLFSENGGQEPLIVQLWKKSDLYSADDKEPKFSFNRFLVERFYRPFIHMNLPLMVQQGIVPQIHGQNVILALDPQSGKFEAILHRDIGSMKTDYRLRAISGLPIDPLRTPMADKDFGLSWGAEQIEKYHRAYLHDWLLSYTYMKGLQKYVPGFQANLTRPMVLQALNEELGQLTGVKDPELTPTQRVLKYISEHPPQNWDQIENQKAQFSKTKLRTFLAERKSAQQAVELPESWMNLKMKDGYLITDYGVIYSDRFMGREGNRQHIAFFSDSQELEKFSGRKKIRQTAPACHLIFASGF